MIIEGLNDEFSGYLETMYPKSSDYLFTKTLDEIWNFFEHVAHDDESTTMLERPLITPLPALI